MACVFYGDHLAFVTASQAHFAFYLQFRWPLTRSGRKYFKQAAGDLYFKYYRNMEIDNAVRALGALAHATRLQIFRLLVQAGAEGLTVSRIAEQLDIEANGRLSFHLKELVAAGMARSKPCGRFVFYAANYPAMNELLAYLTEHCCAGTPCGLPTLPAC